MNSLFTAVAAAVGQTATDKALEGVANYNKYKEEAGCLLVYNGNGTFRSATEEEEEDYKRGNSPIIGQSVEAVDPGPAGFDSTAGQTQNQVLMMAAARGIEQLCDAAIKKLEENMIALRDTLNHVERYKRVAVQGVLGAADFLDNVDILVQSSQDAIKDVRSMMERGSQS